MSPIINGRLLYNEQPTGELIRQQSLSSYSIAIGFPEPGKTTVYDESQIIDLDNVALNGGMLVKTTYLSIDPYLRFRMRDPKDEKNLVSILRSPSFGIN